MNAAYAVLARIRPLERLVADRSHDANRLRKTLQAVGITPVFPSRCNRKCAVHDERRHSERRWVAAICRLDFRRGATRYDKLSANFLSTVTLAAIVLGMMRQET
jgi:transposase